MKASKRSSRRKPFKQTFMTPAMKRAIDAHIAVWAAGNQGEFDSAVGARRRAAAHLDEREQAMLRGFGGSLNRVGGGEQ